MRVLKMGIVEHEVVDTEMRRLQKLRIAGEIPDTMILVEHPEVVTIGPRARKEGIVIPNGYASRPVDRGGGLTWHGPGQVICYPIIEWQREGEAHVGKIISLIEGWIISALGELGISARSDERMRGVWVGDNKVASIGLSFFHWTSRHGFTINYDTPSGRLEEISGCGLESQVTTSLAALGHRVSKGQIHDALISTVSSINREITESES
jgi:lipoate-protein ligase B